MSPVARFDGATFSGESVPFESLRAWNNVTFEWDYPGGVTCPNVSTLVSGTARRQLVKSGPITKVFAKLGARAHRAVGRGQGFGDNGAAGSGLLGR